MSSNYQISVTADKKEALKLALQLMFLGHSNVEGYVATTKKFKLFWAATDTPPKEFVSFPFKVNEEKVDFLMTLILGWLADTAVFEKQPDHDGDNAMGWKASTDNWGAGDGDWRCSLLIEPEWAMYGK